MITDSIIASIIGVTLAFLLMGGIELLIGIIIKSHYLKFYGKGYLIASLICGVIGTILLFLRLIIF
jgi:uncharacterized membrane protein YiaA